MSNHEIAVVEVGAVMPHPNADKLELTQVWGWQCCVPKGAFRAGDKAVYIPPDYVVPTTHPSFAFLAKPGQTVSRIRVRRLRGQLSQGLLIGFPPELADMPIGEDVIEQLGIVRYEPPMEFSTGGMFVVRPSDLYAPQFDVDSYQRYRQLFIAGEEVVATEKLHGANARFVYAQDKDGQWQQFCGSRTNWIAEDEKNIWWRAFRACPGIGEFCRSFPNQLLYGEAFGQVQALKYGQTGILLAAFALLDKQTWVDYDTAKDIVCAHSIPWAPEVYRGPFDEAKLLALAEGDSRWPGANHMAEGLVVVPVRERTDPRLGRVCLKMVSNRYLESN